MNVAKKKLIKRPINIRPNELRDITGNEIEHNKLFEDTGFISEDAVELEIDPMPRYVLLLSLMKTGITASLGIKPLHVTLPILEFVFFTTE